MAVQHKGIFFNRTKELPREAALQQAWEKHNLESERYSGSGCRDFLESLFTDRGKSFGLWWFRSRKLKTISNRDRMIVATVIQWLGSNVGFNFLSQALLSAGYVVKHSDFVESDRKELEKLRQKVKELEKEKGN